MPDSRARRRASGDAFGRPFAFGSAGAGWAVAVWTGAASPICAIGRPIGTVSPSPTRIRSVPAVSASKVTVALSVSTSASGSPSDTRSPSCLSQRTIVPSSIESDRRGMTTSGMNSGALADRRGDRVGVRDERVLESRAVGNRQLAGGQQPHVVEVVQAVLGHAAKQTGRPSAGGGALFDGEQAIRAGDRLEHNVEIEGPERAQV